MTYQQFQNKWLGKSVDVDKVYGKQCVDLVKQYMLETKGIPNGAYGNAIDYWVKTHTTIRKHFIRVATSSPQQGDVVVLKGVSGNPYGHIGIASGNNTLITAQILEQNGSTGNGSGTGGDAIRLRHIPKWRIVGVLRPSVPVPPKPVTQYHTVIKGETLSAIAKKYGATITKLQSLNPQIKNINVIFIGQKIRVK